jgi:hypothetical protein
MDAYMKVNGKIIKKMEMENILIKMEPYMKVNGKMIINKMDMEN